MSAPVADAAPGLGRLDLPIARAVPEARRIYIEPEDRGLHSPRPGIELPGAASQ